LEQFASRPANRCAKMAEQIEMPVFLDLSGPNEAAAMRPYVKLTTYYNLF